MKLKMTSCWENGEKILYSSIIAVASFLLGVVVAIIIINLQQGNNNDNSFVVSLNNFSGKKKKKKSKPNVPPIETNVVNISNSPKVEPRKPRKSQISRVTDMMKRHSNVSMNSGGTVSPRNTEIQKKLTKVHSKHKDSFHEPKRKLTKKFSMTKMSYMAQKKVEEDKIIEKKHWRPWSHGADLTEVQLYDKIGEGSYAEVFVGVWRETLVAVKQNISKNPKHEESFLKEIEILSKLKHPNVLLFIGACKTEDGLVLVTEYMENGDLYSYLRDVSVKFSWKNTLHYAVDVARGMTYVHQEGVLQRDIKSKNLLVNDRFVVKISDFGTARSNVKTSGSMTHVGTPFWAAPEMLSHGDYTEKADVYSFAIVLWELVARKDPYQGKPAMQIPFKVVEENLRPKIPSICPDDYEQLMKRCWSAKPEERPSFSEILEELFDMELKEHQYQGKSTWRNQKALRLRSTKKRRGSSAQYLKVIQDKDKGEGTAATSPPVRKTSSQPTLDTIYSPTEEGRKVSNGFHTTDTKAENNSTTELK